MGTMHSDINYLSVLYWGFDDKYLYLRVDGQIDNIINKGYNIELRIFTVKEYVISFELKENAHNIHINNIITDKIQLGCKS